MSADAETVAAAEAAEAAEALTVQLAKDLCAAAHGRREADEPACDECYSLACEVMDTPTWADLEQKRDAWRNQFTTAMASADEAWAKQHAAEEARDTMRDELAHAIRTRDEWESNAEDAERALGEAIASAYQSGVDAGTKDEQARIRNALHGIALGEHDGSMLPHLSASDCRRCATEAAIEAAIAATYPKREERN